MTGTDRETTLTPRPETMESPKTSKQKVDRAQPSSTDETGKVGGDLKELEMMFGLWRSAGRNINLWDWLEGFRGAMTEKEEPEDAIQGQGEDEPTRRSKAEKLAEDREETDQAKPADKVELDAETQDRLHATFVRFCEEARMLGLVRARGGRTARKADEVVKGIGLV